MNAAGLAVSVNMIQDDATIDQQTGKPGLTTTTAVRLLLNQAATVEEAVALLEAYDLHGSHGHDDSLCHRRQRRAQRGGGVHRQPDACDRYPRW